MSNIICQVYRSSKKSDMYLYVDKKEDLARVPESLLGLFGRPQAAMVLLLTVDKKLAKADAADVMQKIQQNGFYLQLPPVQDNDMQQIASLNSKLSR